MPGRAINLEMASELDKQLGKKGVTIELTQKNLIANPYNLEKVAEIIRGESPKAQPWIKVGEVKYFRHPNGDGLLAETAEVAKTAFVGPFALVKDKAKVLDKARIRDRAIISGEAEIKGEARVSGSAQACGSVLVCAGYYKKGKIE